MIHENEAAGSTLVPEETVLLTKCSLGFPFSGYGDWEILDLSEARDGRWAFAFRLCILRAFILTKRLLQRSHMTLASSALALGPKLGHSGVRWVP